MRVKLVLAGVTAAMALAACDSPVLVSPPRLVIGVIPAILEKRTTYVASANLPGGSVSAADLSWASSDDRVLQTRNDGSITAQDTGVAYVKVWMTSTPAVRDSAKITVVLFNETVRELSTVLRVFRADGTQVNSGTVSGLIRPIGVWSLPNGVALPVATRVTWNGVLVCSATSEMKKGEMVCEMDTSKFPNGQGSFRFEVVNPANNAVMASTSYPTITIAN